MSLTWTDPPKSKHTKWKAVAAELQQNPGAWALVGEDVALSVTHHLKTRYGLEILREGVSSAGRVERVFARWPLPVAAEANESVSTTKKEDGDD